MDASNEVCQRLHTPPRALLNMDITQRNAHQLQTRASMSPPPPAPVSVRDSNPPLHPPLSALVSQRREALVRTNPRIRPVSDFYNGWRISTFANTTFFYRIFPLSITRILGLLKL